MRIVEPFKNWLRRAFFKGEKEADRETNLKLLDEARQAKHSVSFLTQQLMTVEGELAVSQSNFLNTKIELDELKKRMRENCPRQAVESTEAIQPDTPLSPVAETIPSDTVVVPVTDFGLVARPELAEEVAVLPLEDEAQATPLLKICEVDDCGEIAAINFPEMSDEHAANPRMPYNPNACPLHQEPNLKGLQVDSPEVLRVVEEAKEVEKRAESEEKEKRGSRGRRGKRPKKRKRRNK